MASFNEPEKDGCNRLVSVIIFAIALLACACGIYLALWLRDKLTLVELVPGLIPLLAVKNAYTVRPSEIEPGDIFPYMIVAVAGRGYNDWAAYRGPADWTPEQVAAEGDKIPYRAAYELFPTLDAWGTYRD